jgi:alpha-L-fucosidase
MTFRHVLIVLALYAAPAALAQDASADTRAAHDARMTWWRDARFGMFIHWGAYSVPAGSYKGERIGTGEWIMNSAPVPILEYEKFVHAFNPVKYDADAWARTAKTAGMKYIIITSKHHDGFAMFDSKVSSYDLVDAAPYHRDAIKAIAAAAHRQGLRFGVYYSIMDWHHPDAQAPNFPDYNKSGAHNPHFGRYVDTYLKPQVRELLTQYPEIDVLWFDGEWIADWTDDRGRDLYNFVRAIKPSIIVNNRVANRREGLTGVAKGGGVGLGDFGTPEQQVPAEGIPGADWESCMTINDNWGYQSFDDNWKTPRFLLRTLVDVASKGGNLLLNVGPTSLGEIPHESVSRLQEMGQWLRVNGEAIYGTTASRYGAPTWGRYTSKPGVTYAHVFDWPKDGKLTLAGVKDAPREAYLLADHKPLSVTRSDSGFVVQLPRNAPSSIASVIVLMTGAPGKPGD